MRHSTALATFVVALLPAALRIGTAPVGAQEVSPDDPVLLTIYEPGDLPETFSDGYEPVYLGPRWTASAGAVILHRQDLPWHVLVEDPETGSPLMTSADINLGWAAGPRFELIRHFDSGREIEFEYFGVQNWAQTAHAQNGRVVTDERWWRQFVFDDLRAYYGSDFHSVELNLRRPLFGSPYLKGFVGLRYLELREELVTEVTLIQDPFVFTNRGDLDLNNHLYGAQLGLEGVLWDPSGPFRLDGFIKAGIYGNHVDWDLVTEGDLDNRYWDKGDCRVSYEGETALMLVYKPCCCSCWELFAGYEVLWLNGVINPQAKQEEPVYRDITLDGVFFGLEFCFGKRYCCARQTCSSCSSCSSCE
jgi:hypothetical protein